MFHRRETSLTPEDKALSQLHPMGLVLPVPSPSAFLVIVPAGIFPGFEAVRWKLGHQTNLDLPPALPVSRRKEMMFQTSPQFNS